MTADTAQISLEKYSALVVLKRTSVAMMKFKTLLVHTSVKYMELHTSFSSQPTTSSTLIVPVVQSASQRKLL